MKDACRAVYGGASMINKDCRHACLVPIGMEAIYRSWVNFIYFLLNYFSNNLKNIINLFLPF